MPAPPSLQPLIDGRRRTCCCHRAFYSGKHPENSLEAVIECVRAGVPRLEIDVRFLNDDSMLIHHDAHLGRVTTGSGSLSSLDRPAAKELRYVAAPGSPPFLEQVVAAMKHGDTLLQVDLTLVRPATEARLEALARALDPIRDRVLIGSQAHWNLRPMHERGYRVALDPTFHWHYYPDRPSLPDIVPQRLGRHGLWDDALIAYLPHVTAEQYLRTRIEDLVALLPFAVEWMVDIATLRHIRSLGLSLGDELSRRGIDLAAWTVRDQGPAVSGPLLSELFALGASTVITDHPMQMAAYAADLGV